MEQKHFLLDMDGVISDIFTGLLTLLNERYKKNVDIETYIRNGGTYNVAAFYGISNEVLWNEIIPQYDTFWSEMPAFPWTVELFQFLKSMGEVTIVSKPTVDFDSYTGKLRWLKRVLEVNHIDVFLGSKKYLMAGNGILIDDNPEFINGFRERGGQAILVPSNWNTINLTYDMVKQTIIENLK